ARTTCIHAIDVPPDDVVLMKQRGVAVAHCPRSNGFHHGTDAPVARYLEAGLRVGLGTDSEISVAPPDLFAEARAAQELTGWDDVAAVRALTLGGAEVIGRAARIGSLEVGKDADLLAIRMGQGEDPD